ncbi:hypothetical protein VMCG_07061 [Cytospora schulzeri]|uniref:protein-tyrosine-phosphatase n=1 Tax=Cytospora schulzeri TaxID=448051 RepID=A0A423W3T9_9PEZI|nr:hypothetical protein VMCG_07061 [Valsa malicola]
MDLYAFNCNFCGTACPVDCLPTHRDKYICHNVVCFAHAPSDLIKFNPIRKKLPSSPPVDFLATQTDALDTTTICDTSSSTSPPREKTDDDDDGVNEDEEEDEEDEEGQQDWEESTSDDETPTQEEKIDNLVDIIQSAPGPSKLDNLFQRAGLPSITEIVPGLFLGNMACVDNEAILKSYKINAVISIVSPRRMPFPRTRAPGGGHNLHPLEKRFSIKDRMVIVASDRRYEDLIQHFEGACNFIYRRRHPVTSATVADSDTDARSEQEKVHLPTSSNTKNAENEENPKGGRVLVHCTQGVSRSATIVAAYLMWRKRETAAKVLAFMKSKRPRVHPNYGFLDQLVVWEDVRYVIWESKRFLAPCDEYSELKNRLRRYEFFDNIMGKPRRRLD